MAIELAFASKGKDIQAPVPIDIGGIDPERAESVGSTGRHQQLPSAVDLNIGPPVGGEEL